MTTDESVIGQYLHRCIRCGNCKLVFRDYVPSCPSGEFFGFETYYASGRIRLAQALERGDIGWDSSLLVPLFACTACSSCEEQCLSPHAHGIVDIIEELRRRAVDKLGPLAAHQKFADNILRTTNPYGEKVNHQELREMHDLPESAENVYFIGCTANYREQGIRDATISLLKKAGVDFTILDEQCCGSPLIRTGQLNKAEGVATKNIELFDSSGASRILTSCAGCYRTLASEYPTMARNNDYEVLHISQFLDWLIDSGKLQFEELFQDKSITYHDPCHLGRHMGVYEEPRRILSNMGVEIIEMESNKENAWCCGSGGGVKSAFKDMALETARERVRHARAISADILLSACPFCKLNLSDGAEEEDIEILDLVELIDRFGR